MNPATAVTTAETEPVTIDFVDFGIAANIGAPPADEVMAVEEAVAAITSRRTEPEKPR